MATRPPTRHTRAISFSPATGSGSRKMTLVAVTTSNVPASNGRASTLPGRNSAPGRPAASSSARATMLGSASTPTARQPRRASSRTSAPGPQPTSSTRWPGCAPTKPAKASRMRAQPPDPCTCVIVSTDMLFAVELPHDLQAVQGQPRRDDVDDLGFLRDQPGQPAGADDLHCWPQLAPEARHHALHQADVAEDEPGLDGVDGVAPNDRRRPDEVHLGQLGRALEERV